MKTLILILICALSIMLAIGAFIENVKTKRELKAEKKKEKENAKIDQQTVENINAIVSDDVHAGNDVLHQLAEKRK